MTVVVVVVSMKIQKTGVNQVTFENRKALIWLK